MSKKMEEFEKKSIKEAKWKYNIGDNIDVHFRITEGDKTRIQIFSGVVISEKGGGVNKNFTVRRISYGEGVERIFPYNSPLIENIVVKKRGNVRRAKLYYLRQRVGKSATKVKEKIG
ncbi:MAG: 50S ribosomal protein L19 [Candidatus Omnitrophica bacterium]|nr:50S ribosomal protein L19 [Candidatus Omnitrophota bacterium]